MLVGFAGVLVVRMIEVQLVVEVVIVLVAFATIDCWCELLSV